MELDTNRLFRLTTLVGVPLIVVVTAFMVFTITSQNERRYSADIARNEYLFLRNELLDYSRTSEERSSRIEIMSDSLSVLQEVVATLNSRIQSLENRIGELERIQVGSENELRS